MTSARRRLLARTAGLGLLLLALPACQQKMAQQPYFRPYEESDFFPDKRSARPLVEGTVARSQLLDDDPLATGLTAIGRRNRAAAPAPKAAEKGKDEKAKDEKGKDEKSAAADAPPLPPLAGAPDDVKNYVDAFPFKIAAADLRRGQERYTIFCTACHGPLGNGGGKIVERGFLRPPSFHTEHVSDEERALGIRESGDLPYGHSRGFFRFGVKVPLRDVPVGYIFEVITRGYGGMPDYAMQVPPADRWRIAAYVRTLQISQNFNAKDLPPGDRAGLDGQGGKQ